LGFLSVSNSLSGILETIILQSGLVSTLFIKEFTNGSTPCLAISSDTSRILQ